MSSAPHFSRGEGSGVGHARLAACPGLGALRELGGGLRSGQQKVEKCSRRLGSAPQT